MYHRIVSTILSEDPIQALFGCEHKVQQCPCRPRWSQLTIRLDWHGYSEQETLPDEDRNKLSENISPIDLIHINGNHIFTLRSIYDVLPAAVDTLELEIDLCNTPEPILETLPNSFKVHTLQLPVVTQPFCKTLRLLWRRSKLAHCECQVKTEQLLDSIVSAVCKNGSNAKQPASMEKRLNTSAETLLNCSIINSEWDLY